jgi:hypothetical protein
VVALAPKALQVIPLAVQPGGGATAAGRGCQTGVPVVFTIAGRPVGRTTSTADGDFHGPLDVANLAVGSYVVKSDCGYVVTTAPLYLVLASDVNPDSSTLLVLIFFILIGLVLIARQARVRKDRRSQ